MSEEGGERGGQGAENPGRVFEEALEMEAALIEAGSPIPRSSWDREVEDWLLKLEVSRGGEKSPRISHREHERGVSRETVMARVTTELDRADEALSLAQELYADQGDVKTSNELATIRAFLQRLVQVGRGAPKIPQVCHTSENGGARS